MMVPVTDFERYPDDEPDYVVPDDSPVLLDPEVGAYLAGEDVGAAFDEDREMDAWDEWAYATEERW